MSNGTNPANGKTSKLVLILYIAAGVLGALFIYMFVYAINYINSYVSSYGMSFGDMWMDAIQTIINGSINYLVFGLLVFAAGKILDTVQKKSGENHASVEAPAAESVTVNVIEEVKDEEETAAEVAGIKVPPLFR
ncbi:MAG: hypothetical protein ACLRTA_06910 [Clostridia bacterium]